MMNKIFFIGLLFIFGCSLMRKVDKSESIARKEMTKQSYLDKVDIKNSSKETSTFTWWNDSTVFQYQSVREQVDDVKAVSLAAKEDTSELLKQKEKQVDRSIPVLGIGALLGLMIALYLLYKRFLA